MDGLGAVLVEVKSPRPKLLEVAAAAACLVDPELTANEFKQLQSGARARRVRAAGALK